jgi:hypothetical protein
MKVAEELKNRADATQVEQNVDENEDFDSDSDSDSDDGMILDELPMTEMRFGNVLLGIFGPISEPKDNQETQKHDDSGSSDDEYVIELGQSCERTVKKVEVKYYGRFSSIQGTYGAWIPKKKRNLAEGLVTGD